MAAVDQAAYRENSLLPYSTALFSYPLQQRSGVMWTTRISLRIFTACKIAPVQKDFKYKYKRGYFIVGT